MTAPVFVPRRISPFAPPNAELDDLFLARERAWFLGNLRPAAVANFSAVGVYNGIVALKAPGLVVVERLFVGSEQVFNAVGICQFNGAFPSNIVGGGSKGSRDGRRGSTWAIGDDVLSLQDDGALAVANPGGNRLAVIGTPALSWAPIDLGPFYLMPADALLLLSSVINNQTSISPH